MIRCKRKGITLSEICIVLAVVSIVSLAVVSFAAMATGRGATGTDKLKVMQDIELLEAMVDNWFDKVYTSNGAVTVEKEPENPEKTYLKAEDGITIRWYSPAMVVVFPGENGGEAVTQSFRFETVTKLEFEIMKNAENNDEIFFCTVTYAYRRGQNTPVEETYTFCINPRVGESITK